MDIAVAVAQFVLGLALIFVSLTSAFRTVVLPRAAFDPLTRIIFLGFRSMLLWASRLSTRHLSQEDVLAVHAPLGLLTLALTWALGIMLGFALLFDATGEIGFGRALILAGSSFTTLGFESPEQGIHEVLTISAAVLGLGVVALLIAYLPTIYGLFSKREVVVADISIKSGGVAYGPDLVRHLIRDGDPIRLDEMCMHWEHWLIALGETHTAEPSLNFFRSPRSDRSWLTAATAVLDAAIIRNAVVAAPFSARADMAYRAGVEAIVDIGRFFLTGPDGAEPTGQLVSRHDLEVEIAKMEAAGCPIVEDRDEAWQTFTSQRSAYEHELRGLHELIQPPAAPWSSGPSDGREPDTRR
ncbi:MAG: hypothetical protein ACC726_08220 [Chloroflexota bacterium]